MSHQLAGLLATGPASTHAEAYPNVFVDWNYTTPRLLRIVLALAMLAVSFTLLLLINLLQAWARRNTGKEERQ